MENVLCHGSICYFVLFEDSNKGRYLIYIDSLILENKSIFLSGGPFRKSTLNMLLSQLVLGNPLKSLIAGDGLLFYTSVW